MIKYERPAAIYIKIAAGRPTLAFGETFLRVGYHVPDRAVGLIHPAKSVFVNGRPSPTSFKTWVEDRLLNPNCFDSRRIDAIPDRVSWRSGRGLQHVASSPQLAWEA
jgi:hypothetical protein